MSKPDEVTILHNPRCSKSRATLALLEARGIAPTIVPYLEQPPDERRLAELLRLLGKTPREFMHRQESTYLDAGLDDKSLSDMRLIAAMVEHPVLIERPIVIVKRGGRERAALGRPPEAVLGILK